MFAFTVLLLQRGVAFVNLIALYSCYVQIPGLILSQGITPADQLMKKIRKRYLGTKKGPPYSLASVTQIFKGIYRFPSIFWISSTDRFILSVAQIGIGFSLLGLCGYVPIISSTVCMICYLSLKLVSQPWLGLQMHATVVETNFAFILGSLVLPWNEFVLVFLFRFLSWRVMLGCGAVKYCTGDKSWRDGTAMHKHYYTQPLPNGLTHYFHYQPSVLKRLSVWATHIIETPLSFLAFGGAYCRALAFILFVGLNGMINISGNYGFLGIMTSVHALSLLDSGVWRLFENYLPYKWQYYLIQNYRPVGTFTQLVTFSFVMPYLVLSLVPLRSTFYGEIPWGKEILQFFQRVPVVGSYVMRYFPTVAKIYNKYSPFQSRFWDVITRLHGYTTPFRIINRYAKFGTMSKWRGELIIEWSDDKINWTPYEFKYKPGDVNKKPPTIPGHLPGLDWRIWFLPSSVLRRGAQALPDWYFSFIEALLEGRKPVLDLLEKVPPKPPKYIRTMLYDYTIPNPNDRPTWEDPATTTGKYWKRKFLSNVHKPISLQMFSGTS